MDKLTVKEFSFKGSLRGLKRSLIIESPNWLCLAYWINSLVLSIE